MVGKLSASFQGSRSVQLPTTSYTVYVLSVVGDGRRWLVFRRYREWHKLHERLSAVCANVPAIPTKTLFSLFSAMNASVIEARARGLQTFLEACLAHVEIRESELFAAFLAEEAEVKGLVQGDELRDLAGSQPGDTSALSERQTNSELAERVADAFIDLRDGNEPIEYAAMQQRKAHYAPAIARALAKAVQLSAGAPVAMPRAGAAPSLELAADRLSALAARPAASASERALAALAAEALAETLAKSAAICATHDLLVKVP